jgi:hypothetical protein
MGNPGSIERAGCFHKLSSASELGLPVEGLLNTADIVKERRGGENTVRSFTESAVYFLYPPDTSSNLEIKIPHPQILLANQYREW